VPLAAVAPQPAPVTFPRREIEAVERRTAEVRAVSADKWSLRVTLDAALKEDLETLAMLLSHKVPKGDLGAVLREAIRCGIEKHGKRKGAVAPARKRIRKAGSDPAVNPSAIPAEVRREVWHRDGGRCVWNGKDGRCCGSRWQVEIDHVVPPSQGGTSTIGNLRCLCRRHNFLHAEHVYGREHMARFRREPGRTARTGEFTLAGESAGASG
jgi:hypothetical protein